jgi:hypothetical protein
VAHTCNPRYSGSTDQENHSSKPAWANSLGDAITKKPLTEKGWWSEFKPQDGKKRKQNVNK